LNEFFFHVFNTPKVRKDIHASASGVKVRHTSPAKIGEVVVAFPTSIRRQAEIVSALAALSTETERLETLYQQKYGALKALRRSLLHHAFSGAL
jgi:type I restriction enzyme S subunit